MNIINRADAWLIERVYQPLVDFFDRKPQWWIVQCAIVIVLTDALHLLVEHNANYLRLLTGLLCAGYFVLCARTPALLPWLAALPWSRCIIAVLGAALLVTWVLIGVLVPTDAPLAVLEIAGIVTMVSGYYFAACRPPKPREPKTRLASAGGSA